MRLRVAPSRISELGLSLFAINKMQNTSYFKGTEQAQDSHCENCGGMVLLL
jgi:hypothetical protein